LMESNVSSPAQVGSDDAPVGLFRFAANALKIPGKQEELKRLFDVWDKEFHENYLRQQAALAAKQAALEALEAEKARRRLELESLEGAELVGRWIRIGSLGIGLVTGFQAYPDADGSPKPAWVRRQSYQEKHTVDFSHEDFESHSPSTNIKILLLRRQRNAGLAYSMCNEVEAEEAAERARIHAERRADFLSRNGGRSRRDRR
jgi:hypothetical protein